MPLEWLLAVLRDPKAEGARRDRAAEVCLPFLHPRLAAIEIGHRNRGVVAGETINTVQIFSVPRGASVDVNSGTITIDGEPVQATTVEPYEPTPAIAITDQTAAVCEPQPERLEVIEPQPDDPNNITPLAAWRRREEPSDF